MNLPDLTGGPIGSIGMLGPGNIAMYNQDWHGNAQSPHGGSEQGNGPHRRAAI